MNLNGNNLVGYPVEMFDASTNEKLEYFESIGKARKFAEPNAKKKIQRGGSFLCTDQYCTRYMMGTRGKGEYRSATNHLGFRCVKDIL